MVDCPAEVESLDVTTLMFPVTYVGVCPVFAKVEYVVLNMSDVVGGG